MGHFDPEWGYLVPELSMALSQLRGIRIRSLCLKPALLLTVTAAFSPYAQIQS
ncbi:hypothetical protein C8N31_101359 [Sulfitobacter mediterraneus]|uniref:Uncharacterized protein n=1 Tax=Sulfitobacter mediterraneus TaxID=83219 RepID=A0A2T6CJL4_9RHOB|nr:hypothetical protein Z950_3624 [Sulfitobacter mediterraneus KCTC 32188]PTX75702.1 hypothetical protein C8N31_101359 [Sulfitobacter mediterraneus]